MSIGWHFRQYRSSLLSNGISPFFPRLIRRYRLYISSLASDISGFHKDYRAYAFDWSLKRSHMALFLKSSLYHLFYSAYQQNNTRNIVKSVCKVFQYVIVQKGSILSDGAMFEWALANTPKMAKICLCKHVSV